MNTQLLVRQVAVDVELTHQGTARLAQRNVGNLQELYHRAGLDVQSNNKHSLVDQCACSVEKDDERTLHKAETSTTTTGWPLYNDQAFTRFEFSA
jgi:hypothetical protein